MIALFTRFAQAASGTIAVLSAGLLAVLMGFCGLAVDLASVFYWNARLQSATDLAALAVALDPANAQSIAEQSLAANGFPPQTLIAVALGDYAEDPAIAAGARFSASGASSAVRISTQYEAPLYFARILTFPAWSVNAQSTAYNQPIATVGFSSGAVDPNLDLLDAITAAVTGNALNLTAAEVDALKSTRIGVFRLFDEFAQALGQPDASIETISASNIDLGSLSFAAFQALSGQLAAPSPIEFLALNALDRIALEQSGSPPVTVSDVVRLESHLKRTPASLTAGTLDTITLPAYQLVTSYLHASASDTLISVPSGIGIPGLVELDTVLSRNLLGGASTAGVMVGPVGTRGETVSARIRLTFLGALPAINVPLIGTIDPTVSVLVEAAPAAVEITDISCGHDVAQTVTTTLAGQPGLLGLYIGETDDADLTDFATALVPLPATLIDLPALITVSTEAAVTAVSPPPTTLAFDADDMANGTVQRVNSTISLTQALSSLSADLDTTISNVPPLLAGVVGAVVDPFIDLTLNTVLGTLDSTLAEILSALGLDVAYVDLSVASARCGVPVLVN